MATWIFQGNPDKFDLDGYLAADIDTITWLVRQHRNEVAIGDTVFLWKSLGADKSVSGVIAECRVASTVEDLPGDVASKPFWKNPEATKPEPRVDLLVIRVARTKEVLKRDWLKVDPVLRDLSVLKMAQGTNYPVPADQARRIQALWDRTGKDWTWRDSVAGLWAYVETMGGEVSQQPGTPVARVAVAIGRAVPGVYNKVMNFRSIDPNDGRAGMSGAGETDREVWAKFFSDQTAEIDRARLEAEVMRLDLDLTGELPKGVEEAIPDAIATGDLTTLMKRYQKAMASGAFKPLPAATTTTTQGFIRNPLVVEIARLRAGSRCEVPDCVVPIFIADTSLPYCEVHHVKPLSEGGEDTIENTICLCPIHHREAHHGKNKKALQAAMFKVRTAA